MGRGTGCLAVFTTSVAVRTDCLLVFTGCLAV